MRKSRQNPGVRALVADDDPVSLRFLEFALSDLGCTVRAVADGAAAIAACAVAEFDLLLLDRRMPGLGGAALLRSLHARGVTTRAIATSAEVDDAVRAELVAAGFAAVLAKPLRIEDLARELASLSGQESPSFREPCTPTTQAVLDVGAAVPLLDDDAALAAVGGDPATLRALRALLAKDLGAMVARGGPQDANLAEELHRLRAACRYCGATRIEQAAHAIETILRGGGSLPQDAWDGFSACCSSTRDALAQDASSA